MGGSKCSSYANSSGNFNLPRCGCGIPMKLLISNTDFNPKRKFWKCRNVGLDGCELFVWDDELDAVEDANPKSRYATSCKNCERMKDFGMEFGRELGREIGKEIGNKFSQFVIGVIMVCVVLFGVILKSILCNKHVESSFHIFFDCEFAIKLWSWLAGCVNVTLQFTSMEDMWKLCDLNWNDARFNNKSPSWRTTISIIIASTALTGNNTCKPYSNSLRDFAFLKRFRVNIHHPKAQIIKEVRWEPPLLHWLKCNIDGAACENSITASCGGIFRNSSADFVYGFAEPLGVTSAYFAELSGAIRAIEIAYQHNWSNLWLESDSSMVVSAFKNPSKPVAWALRNRWNNALFMVSQMNCIVTHIYREGNQVADLIANHGLTLPSIIFWNTAPMFISDSLNRNKLGISSFRCCSS
ncbi:hypothetical protein TSUD_394640 [Trifolium subterraneum]|uniref:GRF-type domain-containing protein n=1 Tax=Trifolium subterraneum TaxID=3900 RepID=A0A2Z6MS09_TRISU|nr:hypothetical protein TSUD_394640 [Trifolium subterraneum]